MRRKDYKCQECGHDAWDGTLWLCTWHGDLVFVCQKCRHNHNALHELAGGAPPKEERT